MQYWVYRHGNFRMALSDQARNIDGEVVKDICEALNVEKKHSSSYHPEGDGMAERAIQTVKSILRCTLEDKEIKVYQWPDLLQQVAFLFNSTDCVSTGATPYEIMYGEKADLPLTIMKSSNDSDARLNPKTFVEELKEKLKLTWITVGEKMRIEKEKRNFYYNKNTKEKTVCRGDLVYLKNQTRKHTLSPKYLGPYEIVWVRKPNVKIKFGNDTEKVVHLNNCKIVKGTQPVIFTTCNRNKESTVHDQIQPTDELVQPFIQPDDAQPDDIHSHDTEPDDLDLPIAHRWLPRNKAYNRYGEDFVLG